MSEQQLETNIKILKENFTELTNEIVECGNLENLDKISEIIDTYLVPTKIEQKDLAEIPTPKKLREEMLNNIPNDFWEDINIDFHTGRIVKPRIFEPSVGKGGFLIDIIKRLCNSKTLLCMFPNNRERYKRIVNDCIYFSDISELNIFVCKTILNPNNSKDIKLNYNVGNTLELDIKEKWGIDGFDAVIGNPPYQSSCGNKGKGNTLWDKFVKSSLKQWLCKDGYLIFVHPQGWRQLDNKTGKLMLSKQILYLNMNDVNEGQKVFGCSTTFDYYILQNTKHFKETIINDYKNKEYSFDLKNMRFIPNHSILDINKYLDYENENGLIKDRSTYGTERKWMSKEKTEEFKYPCVYSINKNNELSLRYSNTNTKGHFGVTKFIVSNGSGFHKDTRGKYGCTEWAYYIKCDVEDMDDIEKCFQNHEFLNIIDAVKLTSNKYNYSILKYLKKDFWKEFI